MKIIVCAKQVPDTNDVKIDHKKGTLIREGVPSILNPDDANALEAALELKDQNPGTTITVLTMGPNQAAYMIRECLAMGADDGCILSSRAFAGADTCATSKTLAAGIRFLGGADLVFCGRQAIDGDTAQVGPQLGQRLGIPVVSYVQSVKQESDTTLVVQRQLEDGYQEVEVKLPCLLTAVKELNTPRYMTVRGIVEAYEKEVRILTDKDLKLDPSECGLAASPTQVMRSFTPPPKGKGEILKGGAQEAASLLADRLSASHLI
jgi:electron transfer flavoprotein alpha/beta subunit